MSESSASPAFSKAIRCSTLVAGRARDKTIIGRIYGRLGMTMAGRCELGGLPKPTHEVVVEVAHRFQLTKFAYIQTDIQFISRPGDRAPSTTPSLSARKWA